MEFKTHKKNIKRRHKPKISISCETSCVRLYFITVWFILKKYM